MSDEDDIPGSAPSTKEIDANQAQNTTFAPLRANGNAEPKPQSLRQIRSNRSYGGEDGYSCHRGSCDEESNAQTADEAQFTVKFSGDDDPDSPRSISKFRKWIIVLIMAGSALNVYAGAI
jgi:hypothetical protein